MTLSPPILSSCPRIPPALQFPDLEHDGSWLDHLRHPHLRPLTEATRKTRGMRPSKTLRMCSSMISMFFPEKQGTPFLAFPPYVRGTPFLAFPPYVRGFGPFGVEACGLTFSGTYGNRPQPHRDKHHYKVMPHPFERSGGLLLVVAQEVRLQKDLYKYVIKSL